MDDVWYFGGGAGRKQIAVYSHEANGSKDEINLEVGDVIGLAGNHWNGYNKGNNERTHARGLYPSYKAKDLVLEAQVPELKEDL